MKEYKIENNFLIFECPWCEEFVVVGKNEINCCIFRHGTFKGTGEQINPHMPKEECDRLKSLDLIYGCSKPFRVILKDDEKYLVSECDYI